jgi:prevent-host-death family protein
MYKNMFTKVQHSIQSSEFRKNLSKYLKEAQKQPLVVSANRGSDTSVVLSSEHYNILVETYEDMIDTKELTKLVRQDDGTRVSFAEVKKKHGV